MPRPKNPELSTVSFNPRRVDRSIGYVTALIDGEYSHNESLAKATERYALSALEAGMVYMETVKLIAPQFRDGQGLNPVAVDVIPPTKTAIADYTLNEIEASKAEVKATVDSSKQRRVSAKQ